MTQSIAIGGGERSVAARIGLTALNLVSPGLGLMRIGAWRAGVTAMLAPFTLIAVIGFGLGHFPMTSYRNVMLALATIGILAVVSYAVPAVLTWRRSRNCRPSRGWSRWYGLTAIVAVNLIVWQLARGWEWHFYKPFYAPAESMAPTIGKWDKMIADMRWRGPFQRGDVVLFNGPDNIRVSRIAGLPGDTIAMRGGVPTVNGIAAQRASEGRATFVSYDGLAAGALSSERLPGERAVHRVIDETAASEFDDTSEVLVRAGHLFMLGDNRDRSADSRVPAELGGVGMVPFSAIIGRPLYIHWSSDRARIGTQLSR